jgi:hypothetical protein
MPYKPVHPNCRCTEVPIPAFLGPGGEFEGTPLLSAQAATGGTVEGDLTFEAWMGRMDARHAGFALAILGRSRYNLWKTGVPLHRFVNSKDPRKLLTLNQLGEEGEAALDVAMSGPGEDALSDFIEPLPDEEPAKTLRPDHPGAPGIITQEQYKVAETWAFQYQQDVTAGYYGKDVYGLAYDPKEKKHVYIKGAVTRMEGDRMWVRDQNGRYHMFYRHSDLWAPVVGNKVPDIGIPLQQPTSHWALMPDTSQAYAEWAQAEGYDALYGKTIRIKVNAEWRTATIVGHLKDGAYEVVDHKTGFVRTTKLFEPGFKPLDPKQQWWIPPMGEVLAKGPEGAPTIKPQAKGPAGAQPPVPTQPETLEPTMGGPSPEELAQVAERKMGHGSVSSAQELGGGINPTYEVKGPNGYHAVIKPQEGLQYGLMEAESAVYDTGKRLWGGDNPVPATVIRDITDVQGIPYSGKASVMQWVEDSLEGKDWLGQHGTFSSQDDSLPWSRAQRAQHRRLIILDVIIGNQDRNNENWRLDADGRIWGIDHGGSFMPEHWTEKYDWFHAWKSSYSTQTHFTRAERAAVQQLLSDDDYWSGLRSVHGLSQMSVDRARERAEWLYDAMSSDETVEGSCYSVWEKCKAKQEQEHWGPPT